LPPIRPYNNDGNKKGTSKNFKGKNGRQMLEKWSKCRRQNPSPRPSPHRMGRGGKTAKVHYFEST